MGLRAALNNAVSAAFTAIGDIPESATYRRTATAYVPSTGVTTVTNTDYTITKAAFVKYEGFEIDKVTILGTDIKMIFQTSKLAITPNIATDKVVRTDGKVYNVLRVSHDPAMVTTTLQLRTPS
jgi:hypothetical protein